MVKRLLLLLLVVFVIAVSYFFFFVRGQNVTVNGYEFSCSEIFEMEKTYFGKGCPLRDDVFSMCCVKDGVWSSCNKNEFEKGELVGVVFNLTKANEIAGIPADYDVWCLKTDLIDSTGIAAACEAKEDRLYPRVHCFDASETGFYPREFGIYGVTPKREGSFNLLRVQVSAYRITKEVVVLIGEVK